MARINTVRTLSLAALLLLVFAATALGQTPAGKVLFSDEFTGGLDNWFLDTATDGRPDYFSAVDQSMVFRPVWFGNAFAGNPEWTDYIAEIEFEVLEYGAYGNTRFFVRSNKLWEGYGVSVLPDQVWFDRFDGNWDRRSMHVEEKFETPVGKRVTLRMEVRGNALKVYYDGDLIGEAEDADNKYPIGRVGLRADHNSIKVYRVTVWEN